MLLGSDSSSPRKGTSTILTCCVMLYTGNFVEWNNSHRRHTWWECKILSVIFPAWEDLPTYWIVSLTPTSRAGSRWSWFDFTSWHSLLIRVWPHVPDGLFHGTIWQGDARSCLWKGRRVQKILSRWLFEPSVYHRPSHANFNQSDRQRSPLVN